MRTPSIETPAGTPPGAPPESSLTSTPGRSNLPRILGAVFVAVALIVGGIAAYGIADNREPSAAQQLAVAKAATVLIFAEDANGVASGSGAFVSEDLILTNAHVVEGATRIDIAGAPAEDAPVEFQFAGVVETVHPFLDLALVRVTGISEMSALTLEELPDRSVLPLGDSEQILVGQDIRSLGFPSISSTITRDAMGTLSLPVTSVSRGQVVSFSPWPGCTNPSVDDLLIPGGFSQCSPTGDLPRGNVLTDDLTGSGGSGGPVVVGGEIVAVRYGGRGPDNVTSNGSISTGGVALSIPSEYFTDWLQRFL